jgi:hypothetical protein
MGMTAQKSSVAGAFGRTLGRIPAALARLVNFPVAAVFALVGQFAFGWLIMTLTPPLEPTAVGTTEGAVWGQVLLLLLQGAALVVVLSREKAGPPRIYLAVAALIWAVSSMLLVYIALECDLGGVCL